MKCIIKTYLHVHCYIIYTKIFVLFSATHVTSWTVTCSGCSACSTTRQRVTCWLVAAGTTPCTSGTTASAIPLSERTTTAIFHDDTMRKYFLAWSLPSFVRLKRGKAENNKMFLYCCWMMYCFYCSTEGHPKFSPRSVPMYISLSMIGTRLLSFPFVY